jgi:3-deoxy-D-manno-octulosonic-acid transferase
VNVLLTLHRFFLMPLVTVLLPFAALVNRKLAAGMRLRRQRWENLPTGPRPLWIHAASGEFEYAKAVIRELKQRRPDLPIVVTYFSPSFARAVADFPGVDRAIALPLDLPGPCRSFLLRLQPRLLLIARTDLWPEMLAQCRHRQVPVQIFSYTQKKFTNPLKRGLTRWLMADVKRVDCVSETDRAELATLGLKAELRVLGDTRYDQVAYRLQNPKPLPSALHPPDNSAARVPCFVAGSTWSEDEAVLLPALAEPLRAGRLKLVLVPHEPSADHLRALTAQLDKLQLSFARFSERKGWDEKQVLLVDQVGFLAELYMWGDFAFVGGSFRKSVHSVMEALGAGCMTFVGPKHENNREAMEFKNLPLGEHMGLQVVRSAEDLGNAISRALADFSQHAEFKKRLLAEFNRRVGAGRQLAQELSSSLI